MKRLNPKKSRLANVTDHSAVASSTKSHTFPSSLEIICRLACPEGRFQRI
jgi:hypothetical protein